MDCQKDTSLAMSVLEHGLAIPLKHSGIGKKKSLACLDFFRPITIVLGGEICSSLRG